MSTSAHHVRTLLPHGPPFRWLQVQSDKAKLDSSKNNFERGQVDVFLLKKQPRLGQLTAVRVGHDSSGLAPGAWMWRCRYHQAD